jgi:hypothetical protein
MGPKRVSEESIVFVDCYWNSHRRLFVRTWRYAPTTGGHVGKAWYPAGKDIDPLYGFAIPPEEATEINTKIESHPNKANLLSSYRYGVWERVKGASLLQEWWKCKDDNNFQWAVCFLRRINTENYRKVMHELERLKTFEVDDRRELDTADIVKDFAGSKQLMLRSDEPAFRREIERSSLRMIMIDFEKWFYSHGVDPTTIGWKEADTRNVVEMMPKTANDIPTFQQYISSLSSDISSVRDQINALSADLIGESLLELPQERHLIDMYKKALTSDQFSARIQSLAGLAVAINKTAIIKSIDTTKQTEIAARHGEPDVRQVTPIVLLEELLTIYSTADRAKAVCDVFKRLNNLRQGFPAHGDNAEKVLPAYDFFKLKYPVNDFASAWDTILGRYIAAMRELLQILTQRRGKGNIAG